MRSNVKRPVIVNRCRWDQATEYSSVWIAELLLKALDQLGIPYVDLEGASAYKAAWDRAIIEQNAIMVDGCGHGSDELLTGQNAQPLLTKGNMADAELMRGRWFTHISCNFGNALEWFVAQGMKGGFGYTEPFTFAAESFPDGIAREFFESGYSWSIAWLQGKTSRDTWDLNTVRWNQAIAILPIWAARYAIADRDCRKYVGPWDEGPYVEAPAPFKCCLCGAKRPSCQALVDHIRDEHIKPGLRDQRSWICKLIGSWLSCPLS